MVEAMTTQRLLRAVVGSLALAAIVFRRPALLSARDKRYSSRVSDVLLRAATQPGLHWKLPWPIDRASLLDHAAACLRDRPHGNAHAR